MESPRLRSLLRAYLRGLLKPDYPNGIRSVVREELLIHAIECEKMSDDVDRYSQLSLSLLSSLNNKKATINEICSKFKLSTSLNSFIFNKSMLEPSEPETIKSAKLYELLERAGIIKDTVEEAEEE